MRPFRVGLLSETIIHPIGSLRPPQGATRNLNLLDHDASMPMLRPGLGVSRDQRSFGFFDGGLWAIGCADLVGQILVPVATCGRQNHGQNHFAELGLDR